LNILFGYGTYKSYFYDKVSCRVRVRKNGIFRPSLVNTYEILKYQSPKRIVDL